MKTFVTALAMACFVTAIGAPVAAQQTTGTIAGRLVDDQGAAVPGVTSPGVIPRRGSRAPTSATRRVSYRLNALPVGTYDLTAELQGFSKSRQQRHRRERRPDARDAHDDEGGDRPGDRHRHRRDAAHRDAARRRLAASSTSARIESLPLNGRQFANLAATVPGVGLGFHSDPTKSSQFSPQINGGNGRNVNYQIDGGDNNDDTVGGLLQLFPLEAIQEFNFVTQRFKAEYGRSNGGVMNIVTKSGTNDLRGSWFTLFRDKSLNATDLQRKDRRARQAGLPPLSVRRLVRRADRARQGALLRRVRADAAGHEARRSTRSGSSRREDGVYPTSDPREPASPAR